MDSVAVPVTVGRRSRKAVPHQAPWYDRGLGVSETPSPGPAFESHEGPLLNDLSTELTARLHYLVVCSRCSGQTLLRVTLTTVHNPSRLACCLVLWPVPLLTSLIAVPWD